MATQDSVTDGIARCPVRHDYEPYSPEGIADPLGMIAPMREETPVFFCEQTQMWVISRHDDVLEAVRDTTRFSSNAFRQAELPEAALACVPGGMPIIVPSLINSDPPAHKRTRRLANQSFTRPRIAAMQPAVEARIAELLDEIVPRGHCDLISEFSALLPAAVFADILSVSRENVQNILKWGDAIMVGVGTLRVDGDAANIEACREIAAFSEFALGLIADRRANPREDDFLSVLVTATDDDIPALTDAELLSMMSQFVVAGHETTRHLIGTTIYQLLRHPEQLEEVRDDPKLVPNAVEETLRHSGPAKGLYRRTTEEVEIGGATIPAGDLVQVMFASANRDDSAWEDPDRFDIHRRDLAAHVAFGKGEHFCIGAPLARLQANLAVAEILSRMPKLRLVEEDPERIRSLSINGLRRLELKWRS